LFAFSFLKNCDRVTDVRANTGLSERRHSNLYLGNNSSPFDHFACIYHTRFKCNYHVECNNPSERINNSECGHDLEDFGWECDFWDSCCWFWDRWYFGGCNSLIIFNASMARLGEKTGRI
jgi:hypothetical protein